jgi:hypothetical protein
VDFEDGGDGEDNEGWETEDEMEAEEVEQDDSELTFSKHTGTTPCSGGAVAQEVEQVDW